MIAALCAFTLGLLVSAASGLPLVPVLSRLGAKQTVSEDAPSQHIAKQGTPTMGGWMILAGISTATLLYGILHSFSPGLLAVFALTVSYGLVGFVDDLLIARRGRNLGLKAREKLLGQFLFAGAFAAWLAASAQPGRTTILRLSSGISVDCGWAYYPLAVLWIVGISNAVNFTDGLDGLAAGVCAFIAAGLALSPHSVSSMQFIPIFAASLSGACCGFLWHNAHPARIFMGDTGSLALGGAIGGLALAGKAEAPVQLMCLVPWAALFSVVVQVVVFKFRRRKYGLEHAKAHRIFRRTPLHHHFEELGVPETRIVVRMWVVTAGAAAFAAAWMQI